MSPASVFTCVFAATLVATGIGCESQTSPTLPSSVAREPSAIMPPGAHTVPAAVAGVSGVYRLDVAMSRSGTVTTTLRWPNADFSLQLYVTRGDCADATTLVSGGCTVLGRTRPGTLPGVITSPVASGDVITVWVLNPDEVGPQTFVVEVGIT